jgi:hypothetical protein
MVSVNIPCLRVNPALTYSDGSTTAESSVKPKIDHQRKSYRAQRLFSNKLILVGGNREPKEIPQRLALRASSILR